MRRAQCLPEGGNVPDDQLSSLIDRLKEALAFACACGELKRDTEARELWHEIYPQLSEGKPGLLGAMLARAEAQVMRLASIYAVLDCSNKIRTTHLKAALEVWRYAEDSVRFIFGDSLGDPVADTILRHVRGSSNCLTRTDVSNIFARNASSVQIDRAVQQLVEKGLVTQEQEKSDGPGRPTMRIRAK